MPFITNQQLTPVDVETPRKLGITGVDCWWMLNRDAGQSQHLEFHVVELAPGFLHDLHRHPQAGEIVYMLEGEGDHLVEDGDPIRIRAGDLVYIPAGEWHGFRNSSDALVRMVGINEGVTHYMDSGYEDHPSVLAAREA